MATNVEFYERMKELQETQLAGESERLRLEQQLHAYYKSDRRMACLKVSKLQSYWKKICEDEKRSKARNDCLLSEFQRVESHLNMLSDRTERLRLMKEQYENYIGQKYPLWQQKLKEWQLQQQKEKQNNKGQIENAEHHSQHLKKQQKPVLHEEIIHVNHQPREYIEPDFIKTKTSMTKEFIAETKMEPYTSVEHIPVLNSREQEKSSAKEKIDVFDLTTVPPLFEKEISNNSDLVISPPSTSQWPTSPVNSLSEVSELPSATLRHPAYNTTSQALVPKISDIPSATPRHPQYTPRQSATSPDRSNSRHSSVHIPEGVSSHESLPVSLKSSSQLNQTQSASLDTHKSESLRESGSTVKVEVHDLNSTGESMSVFTLQTKQNSEQHSLRSQLQYSNESVSKPSFERQTQVEDHESDINDDLSLPLNDDDAPINISKHRAASSDKLTAEGLKNILKSIQNDFETSLSSDSFYRDALPTLKIRKDIINEANNDDNLDHHEPVLLSMIVKVELSTVMDSLPSGCILTENLLKSSSKLTKDVNIRSSLSPPIASLWDTLYVHMQLMIHHSIMGVLETAQLFGPLIVRRDSSESARAVSLLVTLLQNTSQDESVMSDSSESAPGSPVRMSPTKTGSPTKLDSIKEDAAFFKQSMPRDSTPLTQTAAYRNLLSGTYSFGGHGDDSELDDIENQLAVGGSDLKDRPAFNGTLGSTGEAGVSLGTSHSGDFSSKIEDESIDSSVSAAYIPSAFDKSGRSNVGSSAGARRLAALRTGSESETEVDIDFKSKQNQPEDDRDDFDFYDH